MKKILQKIFKTKKATKEILEVPRFSKVEASLIKILQEKYLIPILQGEGLIESFKAIQKNVICAHQHEESVILAIEICNLEKEGDIFEIGCFQGGMSCKLSRLCKMIGRKYHLFDSFEGLPEPDTFDRRHQSLFGRVKNYNKGDYCGTLDSVKKVLEEHGEISICEFHKGWFEDTLPRIKVAPAFVFMDVDFIKSGRDVLKVLWPLMKEGDKIFTHEAAMKDFVKGILDPTWWKDQMCCSPPILWGAGYGLSDGAKHLAYMEK